MRYDLEYTKPGDLGKMFGPEKGCRLIRESGLRAWRGWTEFTSDAGFPTLACQ
jgi:hypothetical protein